MSFQAYLVKTTKSAQDFINVAKKKKLTEFKDIIAWLKKDFGLGLGHARLLPKSSDMAIVSASLI